MAAATALVPPSLSMISPTVCIRQNYDIRNFLASPQFTKSVIDVGGYVQQGRGVLSHDEILAELILRLDAGLKAKDVAAHLKIAPARVTEMRKGDRRVQQHELVPLAEFLGLVEPKAEKEQVAEVLAIWREIPAGKRAHAKSILETFTAKKA